MGSGTGRRKLQSARAPGPSRQTRTRTRQNRGALITDPAQSTALLTTQLHSLGLYAANILGDGNCLFRALADQYYGSPSKHLELRGEICEWIARNRERYAPFVDDERGLDVHLGCMRRPGTYGGHLELSAFAHLKKRNVKVIQPGLVYVIEWSAGGDDEDEDDDVNKVEGDADAESDDNIEHGQREGEDGDAVMTNGGTAVLGVSSRELRKLRREKLRKNKQKDAARALRDAGDEGVLAAQGTVYVAYHDWEHFSSVRNLTGPHAGLPCVVERPQPGLIDGDGGDPDAEEREQERERERRHDERTTKKKRDKPASKVSVNGHGDAMDVVSESPIAARPTMPMPTDIPLPPSRSLSPAVSSETSTSMSSGPGAAPYPHIHSSQTAYLQTGSHPAQSGHSPLANGHATSGSGFGSDSSSTQPHPSHTYSHSHAHSNPALPKLVLRIDRSPKRSFDESEGESGAGGGGGRSGQGRGERDGRVRRDGGDMKRTRVRRGGDRDEGHVGVIMVDDEEEEEEEGEAASDSSAVSASQSSAPSSSSSHSRSSSPSSSPPHQHTHARTPPRTRSHLHAGTSKTRVVIVPPSPASHLPPSHPLATSTSKTHSKLTKRQRKVLGLPKERVVGAVGSSSVASRTRSRSTGLVVPGAMVNGGAGVGKIVIPGGKFRGGGGGRASGAESGSGGGGGETEEWRVNGAGRLDVRGFRELKI